MRFPAAIVPYHYSAAAILSFRNRSLETPIFNWMIFDLNCQSLIAWVVARALCDRPALKHTVPCESEIVMQTGCSVLLDNKGERFRASRSRHCSLATARLGGDLEVTHRAIARELL